MQYAQELDVWWSQLRMQADYCVTVRWLHSPFLVVIPSLIHPTAMQQPKQGSNLSLLAAGNYLRTLGIENQADVTRILDILTNKNSLFGTKGGKTPINPYVCLCLYRYDYCCCYNKHLVGGFTPCMSRYLCRHGRLQWKKCRKPSIFS